jgi:hypothetical protein
VRGGQKEPPGGVRAEKKRDEREGLLTVEETSTFGVSLSVPQPGSESCDKLHDAREDGLSE